MDLSDFILPWLPWLVLGLGVALVLYLEYSLKPSPSRRLLNRIVDYLIKRESGTLLLPNVERRTNAEMLGEFWREAAVLIAVFGPLDLVLEQRINAAQNPGQEHASLLTLENLGPILGLAMFLQILGMVIERFRGR